MSPIGDEPSQPFGNSVRGLLFGSVAEGYERYRLGYPKELVDTVLRYAEGPVGAALEVGAGTGKATLRGPWHRGHCARTRADMANVLVRVTQGLPVRPVVTTFEHFRTIPAAATSPSAPSQAWVSKPGERVHVEGEFRAVAERNPPVKSLNGKDWSET
jgi:hypothetical protein